VIKIKKFTIEQISNEEEISQKKIRKHIAAGLLEAEKESNKWSITSEALEEWLNGNKSLDSKAKEWLKENYSNNDQEQLALFNESEIKKEKTNPSNGDDVNWTDISNSWTEKNNNGYNYIELFAGAGGLSLGYKMAGFKGVLANEVMEKAVETYKHNFNHPIIDGDIREQETKNKIYEAAKGKDIDLISGGFPCKGFSLSGYRIVTDERNNLYKEMLEVVKHIKPKFVVMDRC
jgi:DNA (cytosine-5)-methyltransferase 1